MKKIIFTIFFFAFFTVLNVRGILACSCMPSPEGITIEQQVKEAYVKSSIVFVGEVVEVIEKDVEVIEKTDDFFVTVKFKVEKTWNNKKFQKEITVLTGRDGGLCGYSFEIGKKYLVYTSGDNKLATSICTRTAPAKLNKDIAILNELKKPKSSPR